MGVRPARDTDLPAIESLQRSVSHPSPGLLNAWPAVDTLLAAADASDRPVGYLLDVGAHLTELAVSPDCRCEGRAAALVKAFRDAHRSSANAADTPLASLVRPGNDSAHACYETLGFRRDARVPDVFDGDDGFRFVLD